jgi:hypothetical protein
MDNLPRHKIAGVREAIEARGTVLLYLPAYSPDLTQSSEPSPSSSRCCGPPPLDPSTLCGNQSATRSNASVQPNTPTTSPTRVIVPQTFAVPLDRLDRLRLVDAALAKARERLSCRLCRARPPRGAYGRVSRYAASVAIPLITSDPGTDVRSLFGTSVRLSRPIDFQAIDNKPIDVAFLPLIPAIAGTSTSPLSRPSQDAARRGFGLTHARGAECAVHARSQELQGLSV